MRQKSCLLHQIEEHLGGPRLRSVADLREHHPWISQQYPQLGLAELEEVVTRLKVGTLQKPEAEPTATEPETKSEYFVFARQTAPLKKSKLTREEMRQLRDQGKSLSEIGELAGISKQAVHQHIGRL